MATRRTRRTKAAFTLVEVCLALGIVAIALIPLVAMIPVGLNAQRQAIDATVAAQIVQRISSDAEQADFASLVTLSATGSLPMRYFNSQANEMLLNGNPDGGNTQSIYDVKTTVVAANGRTYDARTTVSDSAVAPTLTSPVNLLTMEIQIANNPGKKPNPLFSTYFIYVARNGGTP